MSGVPPPNGCITGVGGTVRPESDANLACGFEGFEGFGTCCNAAGSGWGGIGRAAYDQ